MGPYRRRMQKLDPVLDPVARNGRCSEPAKALGYQGFREVGETGFEPATARPPAGCATRLRHSPWSVESTTDLSAAGANMCSWARLRTNRGSATAAVRSNPRTRFHGAAASAASETRSAAHAARHT